jgi:Type II CAAX prenyl endopeptidase Rce1-like
VSYFACQPWPSAFSDASMLRGQVMLQFCYTTAFGWFAAYAFLRTQQLQGVVLAHSFCNALGVPPVLRMARHRHRWALIGVLLGGAVVTDPPPARQISLHSCCWTHALRFRLSRLQSARRRVAVDDCVLASVC